MMADAAAAKKKGGVVKFAQEVRAEARKVTWTTRKEVTIATIMVFVMVVFAAVFFFLVDWALRGLVGAVLGLTGGQ
jgi:preprotein translocase subunit SecE